MGGSNVMSTMLWQLIVIVSVVLIAVLIVRMCKGYRRMPADTRILCFVAIGVLVVLLVLGIRGWNVR